MPSRDIVSEDMLVAGKQNLYMALSEFYNYRTRTSLIVLIIYIYEVAITSFTLHSGKESVASWRDVKDSLTGPNKSHLVRLRDRLAHEFLKIKDVYSVVYDLLEDFGNVNFKIIEKEIFGYDINLYENILSICEEKIN